jgi:hypothetical protein
METTSPVARQCPATHCTGGPPVADGILCEPCRRRLADDVASLPDLYTDLADSLPRAAAGAERISGGGLPGLPLDERAVRLRAQMVNVLSCWAGLVADGQRVAPPARTVPALARFLGRHLGWLTGQPVAGVAADEIGALVRYGRRNLSGEHTRRLRVGPCVHPGCSGTLMALLRRVGPLIRCNINAEHCWRPDQWHVLNRRREQGNGLTATDITAIWGIAPNTVYWLANRHHWRRYRDGRHVFYDLGDVTGTVSRPASG